MSFILDALKKSEAERRQGEIPGLNNHPGSSATRRRSFWPLLLTLALLLNGGVFGGWLLLRQEKPTLEQAPAGDLERILADRRAVSSVERLPSPPPSSLSGEAESAPMPVKPLIESPDEPARPTAAASAESPDVNRQVRGEPAAAPEASVDSLEITEPAEPAEPVQLQPVAVQGPAAPAPAASFPPFSELPEDVRSGLPGLNLQLHFYSMEPARRLVRLNGYNLREGDRGGDGLSVEEITPDGIRLSCRGVRFFLPTARR